MYTSNIENQQELKLKKEIEELELKIDSKNDEIFQFKEIVHELENKLSKRENLD
jgi:hypothetical protein